MPVRTEAVMGTIVTIQTMPGSDTETATGHAFGWFHEIERRCTRFNEQSELMRLTARVGEHVPVSAMLFEAVRFALTVAEETGGAFDPAIGNQMQARGFDREYSTGTVISRPVNGQAVSYRDVELDPDRKTILLQKPLTLDLGAVAKGLAVDMAARELAPFRDFAIDAGGDLYLGGVNPQGEPWSVGIRHPRRDGEIIDTLRVSDRAVCTSGDYERRVPAGTQTAEHHILDPRTGESPRAVASATVVASGAMLADALATAAFVLGPSQGIQLLERMGVSGMMFTPELRRYETRGLCRAA